LTSGGNFEGISRNRYSINLLNPISYDLYSVGRPSIEHFSVAAQVSNTYKRDPSSEETVLSLPKEGQWALMVFTY